MSIAEKAKAPEPEILAMYTEGDRLKVLVAHGTKRDDTPFRKRTLLSFDNTLGASSASVTGFGRSFASRVKRLVDEYCEVFQRMPPNVRFAHLLAETTRESRRREADLDRAIMFRSECILEGDRHGGTVELARARRAYEEEWEETRAAYRLAVRAVAPQVWVNYATASHEEWLADFPPVVEYATKPEED